jgi:hypothetical protein
MKHIRTGIAGGALILAAQLAPAITPAANADPCFFGTYEFSDWYTGARWGATLSKVEGTYANCVGAWDTYSGTWNGHTEKRRVWPRSDGGTTEMVFARMDDGLWHAHDNASTYKYGVDYRHECEWPRDNNTACTPS